MLHAAFSLTAQARKSGLIIVLALIAGVFYPVQAVAAANIYVIQTSNIKFGNGGVSSIGDDGFLRQPFYKSSNGNWYKLTYSSYPLRYAVGTNDASYSGGTGWNLSGNIMSSETGGFSGMTIDDASGFVTTSTANGLNYGYGTLVVSVNVTTGSRTFKLTNTYVTGQSDSYVKITTKITNTSGVTLKNARLWVGTNDDWVGTSDGPNKQRGNINTGSFVKSDTAATRSPALRITSGAEGILFYSTDDNATTSVNACCQFSNVYNQDPATASLDITHDGSYAMFSNFNTMLAGASDQFSWYYAAGALANLAVVITTVANASALTPTFGTYTPTSNGFTVQISNYDAAYTWAGTATASGSVAISGTGLVTVTGVAANTASTATITTVRSGYVSGSAATAATTSLVAALTPTFGTPTRTANGFTVQISNYNASYTWAGTATASGSVAIDGSGLVTVTGVAANTASTATITTVRSGYVSGSAAAPATTSLVGALTPTFGTPTATANGFTVQISNYNADYTWAGTATASGSVAISGTGLVTVTNVAANTASTATITTVRSGYVSGSAAAPATTSLVAALTPTFGTPTATANGFTVQISNYNALYTWAGTATASGSVAISDTGLVTVTGVAANTASTATITTVRSGYVSGSAAAPATTSLVGALTPTFGTPTATANGFTVQISNYNADYTWAGTATASGSVAISGTGLVTVTNVAANTASTATITTVRSGYVSGSAAAPATTSLVAALTPTFGTPTATANGFTVQISNYDGVNYTWAGTATASGSVAISGSGLVTVTGVAANTASTATITTTRSGYVGGSAAAPATTSLATQAALSLVSETVVYGSTLSLVGSGGSGSGAFTFTKTSGTCTLSVATLTPGDAGSLCTITATKAAQGLYTSASSVFTITVTQAAQATLTNTSTLSRTYGPGAALSVSGGSGTGTVTYAVTGSGATATGCSITGSTLTATSIGTCKVTATKASDTNYAAVSSSEWTMTFTAAAALTITAATLASIQFGSSTPARSSTASTLVGADAISSLTYTFTNQSGTASYSSTTPPTAVGSYYVAPSAAVFSSGGSGNYASVTYTSGTYIIAPATLSAPTAITASTVAGSSTSLKIAFTNANNATSYTARIYLASDGTTLIATATSYTSNTAITGLSAGTAYKVTLTSVGDANYADSSASALSSQISTLSAAAAATITSPTSISKTVGQSHIFSASGTTASDGGTLSYQWESATAAAPSTYSSIAGATGVNYTTPTLAIGDNGSLYRVVVTNAINGTTTAANSSAATLTVAKAPLDPPTAITPSTVSGSATSLKIAFTNASNATSYTARIYLASDGTTLIATATSYTSNTAITGLTAGTAYKVTLTSVGDANYADSSASALSSQISTLSAAAAATITSPTSISKTVGQSHIFSASGTTASDGGTLSYQWESATAAAPSTYSSIAGATGVNYTTPTLAIGDNGTLYRVVVTNAINGTTTAANSSAATLTVAKAPLDPPTAITASTVSGSSTSLKIAFTNASNATSYTARIYLASDGTTLIATATSYTSNTAITGLTAGTAYKVTLTSVGDANYADSSASALSSQISTLSAAAAATITSPTSISKTVGQSHIFSASGTTASDGGTLSYQWESATAAAPSTYSSIAGATGVNYTTPTLAIGDNGTLYRVVVTNAINGTTTAATSSAATLTVAKAPLDPPTAITPSTVSGSATSLKIAFTNASNATSYTARIYLASDGTTLIATATSYTSNTAITGLTAGTAYKVTLTSVGDANYADSSASALSSQISTLSAAAAATITSPTSISKTVGQSHIFSASGTTASDGGTLSYQWESATAAAPSTYSSIAGATGVNYTTPTLAIGDNGSLYRVVVTNAINGTTTAATSSAATLTVAKAPLDPPTAITASTVSGSATSLLVRFTNTSNASSYTARAYLADGTEVGDATTSFLSGSTITGLSPGTSYQITVTAIGNASYSDSAPSSLSSSRTTLDGAVKATITSPSAASKSVGQTHVFSASGTTASDGGTLTYQWQLSTDSATTYSSIAGATGVNYTTPTLAIGDNGNQYRVVVTNAINGTTYDFDSDPATLTVTKIPLAEPTAITPTTVSGSATSLKIAFTNASNATSYTARVYLASDGTTLIATATSYTSNTAITGLSAGTAYKVTLTSVGDANYADSSASALSSQISTLSAAAAATITSPTSVSKTVGQSHIFSASGTTASDGGTLSYQWESATAAAPSTYSSIAGATGVNYTTPTLAIGDNGTVYRVVVTNAINGTTTAANSSAATLTVAKIILSTPSQPSGAVVLGSATSLTVTFTNVSNASSYSVQVYASNGTTEVGSLITGFVSGNTITGLTPGTGYKVAVTAIGDAMYANSSQSTLSALITTNKADISTPSAPTVVGNTDVRKYITASWTAVANATSYTLKLYDSSGSSLLATITSVSGTSRAITDSDYASMADLTGYKVTITAIGDTQYANSAESTNSSLVTTRIPDAVAPTINTQPVNTSASSTQTGTLSVAASASDGGTLSYQWQTSLNGGSSWANASSGSGATTSSYTSATLNSTVSGRQYRVVVTNTRGTTTETTTSNGVTLTVIKSNQSALTLTSITGRFTTPTTLTATGGSTNGSLSYAVTSGGSATGCSITTGNLSTGTTGTCKVIATMAGNSEYNSVASDTTTVTFTTAEQSNTAVLSSAASIGYGSATVLTVGVATAGTVEFLQEGRTIPGCSSIRATVTTAATCNWKPSRLGATRVEAIFRPTSNAFAQASTNIMSISVIPRG